MKQEQCEPSLGFLQARNKQESEPAVGMSFPTAVLQLYLGMLQFNSGLMSVS